jgi:hypothetical protein
MSRFTIKSNPLAMGLTPKTMRSTPAKFLMTKNAFLMKATPAAAIFLTTTDTILMEATAAATFLTNTDATLMQATIATIFDNATTATDDVFHIPDFTLHSSICRRCVKTSSVLATPQSDLNTSNAAKDLGTAMHQHTNSSTTMFPAPGQ